MKTVTKDAPVEVLAASGAVVIVIDNGATRLELKPDAAKRLAARMIACADAAEGIERAGQ